MKYYHLSQYNKGKKYCGHRIMAIPDDKNLQDYLSKYEHAREITKEEWDNEQSFYKVEVS